MPSTSVGSIQDVFQEYVLAVPDYQRGYAWEEKQVKEFLSDLDILEEGRVHYTGTLILDRTSSEPSTDVEDEFGMLFHRAQVVDGQQRLTTIVILLAAIARSLHRHGEGTLAEGLTRNFVVSRTNNRQPLIRLKLNHDNESFWERCVLAEEPANDPPSITSHQRLIDARRLIEGHLRLAEEAKGDDYLAWLNRLRDKVTKGLRLTLYEVDNSAEVGVIFETQNDRGRPLTDLEKTKNLLLYIAGVLDDLNLASEINAAWTTILQKLSSRQLGRASDEDSLLRCHWLLFYNPRPRDWKGFATVKAGLSDFLCKQRDVAHLTLSRSP